MNRGSAPARLRGLFFSDRKPEVEVIVVVSERIKELRYAEGGLDLDGFPRNREVVGNFLERFFIEHQPDIFKL